MKLLSDDKIPRYRSATEKAEREETRVRLWSLAKRDCSLRLNEGSICAGLDLDHHTGAYHCNPSVCPRIEANDETA